VAAAILSRISFLSRVFPFFLQIDRPRFSRVIPSRKNVRVERRRGNRQRREREREKGEKEREQSDFARAGAEETRMVHERGPTIPRCLPFIKLLLNAAFHRTHN